MTKKFNFSLIRPQHITARVFKTLDYLIVALQILASLDEFVVIVVTCNTTLYPRHMKNYQKYKK